MVRERMVRAATTTSRREFSRLSHGVAVGLGFIGIHGVCFHGKRDQFAKLVLLIALEWLLVQPPCDLLGDLREHPGKIQARSRHSFSPPQPWNA